MTLPIGELFALLSLKGGPEFDAGIMGAQRSLNLAGESATRFGATTDRAAVSSGKLKAAQLSAVAANERYNALLNDANASTARLASSEATLIRANERLAATAAQAGAAQRGAAAEAYTFAATTQRSFGSTLATVGKMGLGLAGLAVAFKGVELIHQANEFQQKMLLLQTNAGASAAEVKSLTGEVLKLSPDVATGPNDLADALYHIEQNSHGLLSTAQMMKALQIGAEGAKIGMADVEDTTNTLTIAMASGVKGVDNFRRTMGFMIATAGTGDMRLSQLNEAISTGILSIAKGFMPANDVLRDTAAIFATLGDNGIRGATAMQAYRQTLMGFAQPVAKGAEALASVGLNMTDLRDTMQQHGVIAAMNELDQRMKAGGITANKLGGFLTEAFGRKAGSGISVLMGEIERVNVKLAQGEQGAASFGSKWQATTKTTAFALQRLGAEAQVIGIQIAQHAAPAVAGLAAVLTTALPAALHIAQSALHPFIAGWHDVDAILGPVAHAVGSVASDLKPLEPVLKGTASAVLAMWLAFKGYELARTAVFAVQDATARMAAGMQNNLTSVRAQWVGTGNVVGTEAQIMQAEFDAIAASAAESAATQSEAQLAAMRTYQQASNAEIESMAATAAAARASATVAASAAAESAATIRVAGAEARVGWASLAGPIGLAAIGVLTLVTMFHKSTHASKEATDAAKAYTDALSSGGGMPTVIDAVTKQLSAAGIPDEINKINTAFGRAAINGKDFITAISQGQPALGQLRTHLEDVAKQAAAMEDKFVPDSKGWLHWNDIWQTSNTLLGQLNTQYSALSQAQVTEIRNLKAFGTAVTPIQDVEKATHVATDTAAKYAAMLGFQVTKNNDVIGSSKEVNAAVREVAGAFNDATSSGQDFLSALSAFSTSGATAADRASLIGATLKAANGDALAFAGAMAGAASANRQLVDSFAQDNANIADLRSQIAQLDSQKKLSAADTRQLADLHNQLATALKNTERAAINAKTGTIDYNRAGAGPLISNLQAIQTAAMNAASATYQHNKATEGGKQAAIDAYKVYRAQTRGSLIDEAKQLGLTNGQAKKLADRYFSMDGKKVKTLIEAEGTDPILTVLNRIGKLLANITGQDWNVKVNVDYHTKGSLSSLPFDGAPDLPKHHHRAMGGPVSAGVPYIVGEQRAEVFVPNVNGRIVPSVGAAQQQMGNGGQQKGTHIDKFVFAPQINYPEPERASVSLPREMRNAAAQLDGFAR